MNVFSFNPSDYTEQYAKTGYAHIPGGLDADFLEFAQKQARDLIAEKKSMKEWAFQGKKLQFLFEFPEDSGFPDGVFDVVSQVAGLPRETFTLCERHIKAYEDTAKANPPAHKDRVASQIAVGLPLVVPEGSKIMLFPEHHLEVNPFGSTAALRDSLDEEDLPENVLADIEPVVLDVQPGDCLMFRGSSIYHERNEPANTTLLYLKFNSMRLDPIGEDPSTPILRKRSLEIIESKSDAELLGCRVEVSPRLDRISRHYTRLYWKEVIQAYVFGEKEFNLSELELRVFQQIGAGRTGREVLDRLGYSPSRHLELVGMLKRLARLQGINFVD